MLWPGVLNLEHECATPTPLRPSDNGGICPHTVPCGSDGLVACTHGFPHCECMQDIVINSDLWSDVPEILSGGLGFTNIIGARTILSPPQPAAAEAPWRPLLSLLRHGASLAAASLMAALPCPDHLPAVCPALPCPALPCPDHLPAVCPAGLANSSDPAEVRAANGTWRVNVTCSNGQAPPTRVLTSASSQQMWSGGYNCTADHYDGLPVCFSWPVLPSSISKESLLVTLSDGSQLHPPCIGIAPNLEFNERHCLVLFGRFGNRLPSTEPGSLFVSAVEVPEGEGGPRGGCQLHAGGKQQRRSHCVGQARPGPHAHARLSPSLRAAAAGASLKLVGPEGPVSAEGLNFTNPSGGNSTPPPARRRPKSCCPTGAGSSTADQPCCQDCCCRQGAIR